MTTISNRRRNNGSPLRTFLVMVLCVILVAILVVWRGPLAGLFWLVFTPAFNAVQAVTHFGELEDLRAELARTQSRLADYELLKKENEDLKTRLGRAPEGEHSLLAIVLVRPPATPYDTLMLDVGLQDGVAAGDLVFSSGSVVIGKITDVYRSTARATLFSAPGETHDVFLYTQGGSVPLIAEGQGSGSFTGKVPQGVKVFPGDEVIFPNLAPILAARVSAVEADEQESFQTVYMQLPANPFMLHYVEVRKPNNAQ